MKRSIFFDLRFLPFLLLFITVPLVAQWGPDSKLSSNDSSKLNENMGECLAVSGDTVHVVWWNSKSGGSTIYYKHSFDGGVTWGADTSITDSINSSDFPSIAVSGATVHVVFRDTTGGQHASYYKRSLDGGNTWGPNVLLGNYYWWPSITATGSSVFVALNSNSPGNSEVWCRRSTDNGSTWDTVHQISNATGRSEDPSIAAGGGFVHLAWNDNRTGIMQTFYRRSSDNGVSWGPETQLTNAPEFAYFPLLRVFGSNVDLVWGNRTGSAFDIYYKSSADFGATWNTEQHLTSGTATSAYPVIARDGPNIHLVWWQFNGDVYYRHSRNGGMSWDSVVSLVSAASTPSSPFIAVAGPVLHLIWLDHRDGYPAIYYKRNPTGNTTATGGVTETRSARPSPGSLIVFPNPFRAATQIEYSLPVDCKAALTVYDPLGRVVTSFSGESVAGMPQSFTFDATKIEPGAYICRVIAGNYSLSTPLLLLK